MDISKKRLQDLEQKDEVSIKDLFMSTVSKIEPLDKHNSDDSKKMFVFNDVLETTHPLARILRMVLSDNGITNTMFEERHREYAEQAGFLSTQIGYNRNNIKKGMYRPKVTWPMLEAVLLVILGFRLENLVLELRHPQTNEVCVYSTKQILEKAMDVYGNMAPTLTQDGAMSIPLEGDTTETL